MVNVVSFVLNMSTGIVLATVKTPTYLHSLQNVFPMEYTLLPWVLEVLGVIIESHPLQNALSLQPALSNHN